MGNACTQGEMGSACEAAFNLNAEHAPNQSYSYAEHLNGLSKPSPRDLPRLGLLSSAQDPNLGKACNGLKGGDRSKSDFPGIGHVLSRAETQRSRNNVWFHADVALPLEPPDDSPSCIGSPLATCAHDFGEDIFVVPVSSEREDDKALVEESVGEAGAVRQSVLERILLPVLSPRKKNNVTMSSCLGLVFNAEGKNRYVQLHRRPLGAEFSTTSMGSARISKIKPQSYAEELGLQEGWAISFIDGEDVSMKTLKETPSILNHALVKLPTQDGN